MAGLFGNGAQGGYGGAGILGAQQQPWQGTLGILASALKDATNSFSGNGGDTDNLSKWNATQGQNQQRQQLIAGLTSTDPAERQKAYALAPLYGVDPSAFQKQQASQALPQLLTAMQPQQVTAPAANADLGQYGKINVPAANIGMSPGMGFSDALSSVNNPELTSQYGSEVIKQLMEPPKYQESGGGLYELPRMAGGTPTQVVPPIPKAPTMRNYRSGTQEITEEYDPMTRSWKRVASGAAFKPEAGPKPPTGVINLPHPGSQY